MFSWLTQINKSTSDTILSVHIDSGEVQSGLIRISPEDRPHILTSHREEFRTHESKEYEVIFHNAKQALDRCLHRILHQYKDAPSHIIVSLGAPWTASQTRVLEIHYSESRPFTQAEANKRIQEEIDAFHNAEIASFAKYAHDHQLLEHKTMGVRLNGYHTDEPLGKKAKDIALDSFISVIPHEVYQRFTHRIERAFHTDHEYHSSMFMTYTVLHNVLRHRDDALVIDMGAELTEVGIIHNDILLQSISFPFGYYDVYRHIARDFRVTEKEAASLIHLYTHNLLARTRSHEIEQSLYVLYGTWIQKFHTLIKEAVILEVLPHAVFLYAPPDIMRLFSEFLQDDTLTHYTRNQKPYIVTPMDIRTFRGHCIDEEQKYYPRILHNALFAHHAQHRTRPQKKYYW